MAAGEKWRYNGVSKANVSLAIFRQWLLAAGVGVMALASQWRNGNRQWRLASAYGGNGWRGGGGMARRRHQLMAAYTAA